MQAFKTDGAWVVECSDHDWFKNNGEKRQSIIDQARSDGRKADCESFAIFATPDPMFPVYGIVMRKKVHGERISSGTKWTIACTHHIDIEPGWWEAASPQARKRAIEEAKKVLEIKGRTNPGRYEVRLPKGDGTYSYIEHGNVGDVGKTG